MATVYKLNNSIELYNFKLIERKRKHTLQNSTKHSYLRKEFLLNHGGQDLIGKLYPRPLEICYMYIVGHKYVYWSSKQQERLRVEPLVGKNKAMLASVTWDILLVQDIYAKSRRSDGQKRQASQSIRLAPPYLHCHSTNALRYTY